jgi:hypothetical protein
VRTGRGRMTKANGDWYDGEWNGELAEGQGEAEIAGERYVGAWFRGCLPTPTRFVTWEVAGEQCTVTSP